MIYAFKETAEHGSYVDANNVRWAVHTARAVCGRIVDPWEEFESLESALSQWGLVPYVEPEMEEIAD
ncbi:MAG: hypothetical protein IKJ58_02185 [Akkermansia sp.]|nr:hypothetical protein [Akkermansia sp.]